MNKSLFPLFAFICFLPLSCNVRDKIVHHQHKQVPVTVGIRTAELSEPDYVYNYVGRVEPSKSALVLNRISGKLASVDAVKGKSVKKGDVLAVVSSEAVSSSYDIAKATLVQAEDGYARASRVYDNGGISEIKMMEIRTQLEKAQAAEKAAAQAVEDCSVKAPFDGVVGEVFVNRGENVGLDAPLFKILDVRDVEIHFGVPELEYSRINVGDKAVVEIPALAKTVAGVVAVKGVSASELSHSYDFTLKNISDVRQLMPGMVCKVRLGMTADPFIVIPASAVMTDGNGRYVWSVNAEDRVEKIYVSVGGFAQKGVVINAGLKEGDKVIVEGSRKVSTGMEVNTEEK